MNALSMNALYTDLRIGNITVPGNVLIAPLAGYTDAAFRSLCTAYGASFGVTEMVSAEALARGSARTADLMKRGENEALLSVQIFLSSREQAERASPILQQSSADIIDVNCGCPVPKIVKNGAGTALMNNPAEIEHIVSVLVKLVRKPVTVKLRSGWDAAHRYQFLDAAAAAENGGASMITLHPRTKTQGYSGKADWTLLAKLKRSASIPVIGSGDVTGAESAAQLLSETGIDGIMVGRAAVGNPWIFRQIVSYLQFGTAAEAPGSSERFKVMMRHLDLEIADKGEARACREMRKQMCAYTKGLPNSAELRNAVIHAETREDCMMLLEAYFSQAE